VELELALDDDDPLYEANLTALKGQALSSFPSLILQASIQLRVFDMSKIKGIVKSTTPFLNAITVT
jgi:hypothetical protein